MPDSKSITAKEVGARIRSLREAQHDSQEKLAQTLNVSRALISMAFPRIISYSGSAKRRTSLSSSTGLLRLFGRSVRAYNG